MSDILLDNQTPPSTPSSGQAVLYFDNVSKRLSARDDTGRIDTLDDLLNQSTAGQGAGFASDTYLTGSSIPLLSAVPRIGTLYQCTFDVSKSAAGTAAPVIIVRFGTAGTTADTARLTFTFPAQTAAADVGMFTVWALFRSIGAAGVLQGRSNLKHNLAATGLSTSNSATLQVTSGGFDTALANAIIGMSVNGGASAAWTVQLVEAMLTNI